jgi:sialate O-acetylesterase
VLAWVLAFLFAGFVADAGTVRVACVGDSITYGYGLRDRQANAYPVWLGRWLGTNYDVRHFGVSATTLLHRGDYPYVGRPAYTNALEFKADRRVSVSRQFFVSYS